ncbi:hypothetical protein JCM9534A_31150 [Catenuloplanes indicus JCM 9534]
MQPGGNRALQAGGNRALQAGGNRALQAGGNRALQAGGDRLGPVGYVADRRRNAGTWHLAISGLPGGTDKPVPDSAPPGRP